MLCADIPYEIDLEAAREAIVKAGAVRVVVQLPDGLKKYGVSIVNCLKSLTPGSLEVYLHADPVYGSCDIQYGQLASSVKPQLIIHVGHSPYPVELADPGLESPVNIVYVPALSKLDIPEGSVESSIEVLRGYGVRRVGVVTTAQHTHRVKALAEALREGGLEPVIPRGFPPYFLDGQVLGCDYRLAKHVKAEGFIYFGGGVFHPLGLYLATFKPIVKIDPYEGKTIDLTGLGERVYRVRLFKVSEAMNADKWALIVGVKTGQYRPWLVERLRREIEARGRNYVLIASENLTLQNIIAVDNEWIQAFTVTSCPRIPTDDLWEYHKPVLTPGETIMALRGELEPYRFPW